MSQSDSRPNAHDNLLITQAEAARRLQISRAAVCKRVKSGTLPHTRIGGLKLINKNDLQTLPPPAENTTA